MAVIKINGEGLDSSASSLRSITESYETLNTRLNELSSLIQSGWKGDAAASYAAMMAKYSSQAAELISVLSKFQSYTEETKSQFEELDSRCAASIRNSF